MGGVSAKMVQAAMFFHPPRSPGPLSVGAIGDLPTMYLCQRNTMPCKHNRSKSVSSYAPDTSHFTLSALLVFAITLLPAVAAMPVAAADEPIDERVEAKHFTLNVLPLLKEKCFGCHGADADDIKGEYDVRSSRERDSRRRVR